MSLPVRLSAGAQHDVEDTVAWYEGQRLGLVFWPTHFVIGLTHCRCHHWVRLSGSPRPCVQVPMPHPDDSIIIRIGRRPRISGRSANANPRSSVRRHVFSEPEPPVTSILVEVMTK